MLTEFKKLLRQNRIPYLIGCVIVLGLKIFSGNASADDLKWMLTPIARWVGVLSGISFSYDPRTGYVSHSWRFIIAPSCSGIQFMLISIATLLFSYAHRMKTLKKVFFWISFSVTVSYLFTILINGFRIVISIYLPYWFQRRRLFNEWITPESLHTLIGTSVYFTSLTVLYQAAGYISSKIGDMSFCFRSPALWYFAVVLILPFVGRICRNDWEGFGGYTCIVLSVCLIILLVFRFLRLINPFRQKRE